MLEKLRQRQRQITDAAWQCHNDSVEVEVDPSSDGSAFSKKSSQVHRELRSCIDAVSSLITRLGDVTQQRAVISRTCNDLSAWLEMMNRDVRTLMSRPAKLHVVAAETEIRQLEVKQLST